jgi:uncharacterized protein (TIGR03382 family)
VAFTISDVDGGDQRLNVTFPYQAFDLQLSYPSINELNTSIRYFPIRRTLHQEIYMLGRAFLQEVYIIMDYQRGNFSLFEAAFGGNSRVTAIAVDLEGNPGNTTTASSNPGNNTTASLNPGNTTTASLQRTHRLSTGAYAGIGVGSAMGILLLGAAALVWRRRSRSLNSSEAEATFQKAELHGEEKPRLEAMSSSRMEMETTEPGYEIEGSQTVPFEMQGSEVPVYELGPKNDQQA